MKIKLQGVELYQIRAYKTLFLLEAPNKKEVICRDCGAGILPGVGIRRRAYRLDGFLCFECFSQSLKVLTTLSGFPDNDAGFRIDPFFGLYACSFELPKFRTYEIIEAVFRALIDESYTSIEILLGPEGPGIIKIGDIAESYI